MIGTQSRAKKSTVRGDILLVTLATREEEKRRTEAEKRAEAKARDAEEKTEEDVTLEDTPDYASEEGGSAPEDLFPNPDTSAPLEAGDGGSKWGAKPLDSLETMPEQTKGVDTTLETLQIVGEEGRSEADGIPDASDNTAPGDSGYADNLGCETQVAPVTQKPISFGGIIFEAEKQGRDYLLDVIPESGCPLHLQKCFEVIREMTTFIDTGKLSKTRRAKEARFLELSGGFVLRPPAALLKRVLGLHGVDVRELDQVVQQCLIVTSDNRHHTQVWLERLSRWLRRILKSDGEGKIWLGRAVLRLRKQQEQMREKRRKKEAGKTDAYPIRRYALTRLPNRCRKAQLDGMSSASSIRRPDKRPWRAKADRSFPSISSSERLRLRARIMPRAVKN